MGVNEPGMELADSEAKVVEIGGVEFLIDAEPGVLDEPEPDGGDDDDDADDEPEPDGGDDAGFVEVNSLEDAAKLTTWYPAGYPQGGAPLIVGKWYSWFGSDPTVYEFHMLVAIIPPKQSVKTTGFFAKGGAKISLGDSEYSFARFANEWYGPFNTQEEAQSLFPKPPTNYCLGTGPGPKATNLTALYPPGYPEGGPPLIVGEYYAWALWSPAPGGRVYEVHRLLEIKPDMGKLYLEKDQKKEPGGAQFPCGFSDFAKAWFGPFTSAAEAYNFKVPEDLSHKVPHPATTGFSAWHQGFEKQIEQYQGVPMVKNGKVDSSALGVVAEGLGVHIMFDESGERSPLDSAIRYNNYDNRFNMFLYELDQRDAPSDEKVIALSKYLALDVTEADYKDCVSRMRDTYEDHKTSQPFACLLDDGHVVVLRNDLVRQLYRAPREMYVVRHEGTPLSPFDKLAFVLNKPSVRARLTTKVKRLATLLSESIYPDGGKASLTAIVGMQPCV
jgi:hypothetical protein